MVESKAISPNFFTEAVSALQIIELDRRFHCFLNLTLKWKEGGHPEPLFDAKFALLPSSDSYAFGYAGPPRALLGMHVYDVMIIVINLIWIIRLLQFLFSSCRIGTLFYRYFCRLQIAFFFQPFRSICVNLMCIHINIACKKSFIKILTALCLLELH